MKIAYFIHGRGRGHASRSSSIVTRLMNEGHVVRVFGGGDAWPMLRDFEGARQIQPVTPGLSVLRDTPCRVREDRARFRAFRPDVIISDGDMPSVMAAKSMGIRCLVVGHDIVFQRCRLPSGVNRRQLMIERANGAHTKLAADAVAVNFLPLGVLCPRTKLARPDVSSALLEASKDDGHIVAYFRDGNGGEIAERLSVSGREVQLFCPKGERRRGVNVRPLSRDDFQESLAGASAIVGSVGSNLVAEAIALGKPFLGVHGRHDAEQALNAQMVRAAGVGMVSTFEARDPLLERRFIKRVEAKSFQRVDVLSMPRASDAVIAQLSV